MPRANGADEHNQAVILTSDSKPRSRLPIRPALRALTVAVGVRGPLQWRDRSRFSRDSLTPGCFSADDSPADFKERFLDTIAPTAFQANNFLHQQYLPSPTNRLECESSSGKVTWRFLIYLATPKPSALTHGVTSMAARTSARASLLCWRFRPSCRLKLLCAFKS